MRGGVRPPWYCETISSRGLADAQSAWEAASDNPRTEGVGSMWNDLAALAPPLTVAAVFCAGVFWVVRREMGGKRRREDPPEKRGAGK
jgi:hypothetical protein